MKLGIISDTHGYLDLMRRVARQLVEDHGVDVIIHLGDDSTDADELSSLPGSLVSVPGVFEERYKNPSIPNRIIMDFDDVSFLITHTLQKDAHDIDGDIDPAEAIEDGDIKVVLHGHSHLWRIGEEKGVVIINPGHLLPEGHKASRGNGPTYAVLDLTTHRLDAKIFSAEGRLITEKTFFLNL